MAAAKRVRWDCPTGEHAGALGPSRPRKLATVRYCLPCSEAAGVLVERVAPALERKRAVKSARRSSASARAAESLAARSVVNARDAAGRDVMVDVLAEVAECAKLLGIRRPKVTVARSKTRSGTSGRAWPEEHRIHITTSAGRPCAERLREVILHECVHVADTVRTKRTHHDYHGPKFKRALYNAAAARWPEVAAMLDEGLIRSRQAYDLDEQIVGAMMACTRLAAEAEVLAS